MTSTCWSSASASIGREIARLLRAAGMTVAGVGRSARAGDPDFGAIHAFSELNGVLGDADYVIAIMPLTDTTRGAFGAAQFAAMKPTARFFNLGRGASVDEAALVAALEAGEIAGAGLDVFSPSHCPRTARCDAHRTSSFRRTCRATTTAPMPTPSRSSSTISAAIAPANRCVTSSTGSRASRPPADANAPRLDT